MSPYNDLVVVAGQGTIGYKNYHFILLGNIGLKTEGT